MIVDGTDLSTIGVVVQSRSDSLSGVRHRNTYQVASGANQAVYTGRSVEPKTIAVIATLDASSKAQFQSRLNELRWRLRPDQHHTLRWSDLDTWEWLVRIEENPVRGYTPAWKNAPAEIELLVTAADPRARNRTLRTESGSGTPPLVLTPTIGTAPMPVLITIVGNNAANLVDPVLEYRDSSDVVIATYGYTGTLTGSDTLTIDTETYVTELNGSNTIENWDIPPFFEIDPDDGDFLAPSSPDIRLSATSGDADNFQLDYRERYW